MDLRTKIENPICIKIDSNNNYLFTDGNGEVIDLKKGAVIGGSHYGFVLITEKNGKQNELVQPTQCPISALELTDSDNLIIYEENKKTGWIFKKDGTLIKSIYNEFTDEFRKGLIEKIIKEEGLYDTKEHLISPLRIRIFKNKKDNEILCEDESFPLENGLMLGGLHFGFLIEVETENGIKSKSYGTQNIVSAIDYKDSSVRVYEDGKYHPWILTLSGKVKQQAFYNELSRRDDDYAKEHFGLSAKDMNDVYSLVKKPKSDKK